jgi:hypothetical protein
MRQGQVNKMQEQIQQFDESIQAMCNLLRAINKNKGNTFYTAKLKPITIALTKNWRRLKPNLEEISIIELEELESVVDELLGRDNLATKLAFVKDFEMRIWPNAQVSIEEKIHLKPLMTLFSEETKSKLGDKFSKELKDLEANWGHSGDCVAFLFRKILEKAIFLCFARQDSLKKLEDPKLQYGRYYGLGKMIELASKEKTAKNMPFLIPKTAGELSGIKFLGDSAAHDFISNVGMEEILPQLPVIQMAVKQLADALSS